MRLDIAVCWSRRECWIVYDFAASSESQWVWLCRECWVYMISQWVLGYTWALQRLCWWSKKKESFDSWYLNMLKLRMKNWWNVWSEVRWKPASKSQSSLVGSSVKRWFRSLIQSLIQCLMREEEEASFFIVVFIHLLFISICCESPPDVALHAQSPSQIPKFHENVRCYEALKLYIWLAMRWQDEAWLACKRGIFLSLYEDSI